MSKTDYLQFYDLEDYLFNTVRPRFHTQGFLSAFDFFCIVIWKANRSKSKVARRLLAHSPADSLDGPVWELTAGLFQQPGSKERMRYLWWEWGFRLPMASAILTVLYPDDFTIYDYRVCDCLNDFYAVGNTTDFERLWDGYMRFCQAVAQAAPDGYTLREKDRYLWARSFVQQLDGDLSSRFEKGGSSE